LYIQRRYT